MINYNYVTFDHGSLLPGGDLMACHTPGSRGQGPRPPGGAPVVVVAAGVRPGVRVLAQDLLHPALQLLPADRPAAAARAQADRGEAPAPLALGPGPSLGLLHAGDGGQTAADHRPHPGREVREDGGLVRVLAEGCHRRGLLCKVRVSPCLDVFIAVTTRNHECCEAHAMIQ